MKWKSFTLEDISNKPPNQTPNPNTSNAAESQLKLVLTSVTYRENFEEKHTCVYRFCGIAYSH